jgi:hypothetical protein
MTTEARATGGQTPTGDAHGAPDEKSAEERAEEIVERVSAEVVRFARRLVGRAREEIEDIVAEAQSLRQGQRPPQ